MIEDKSILAARRKWQN